MSYDEFWHGDFKLVKYYRKAYELKQKIKEQDLWLQGMYVYEAILDASPILHAFAKSGTRPRPYPEKPYGFKDEEVDEYEKEEMAERERLKAKVHFMNLTRALQNKFGKE